MSCHNLPKMHALRVKPTQNPPASCPSLLPYPRPHAVDATGLLVVTLRFAVNGLFLIIMQLLQEKDTPPQQSDLLLHLPEMNACFNKDSLEAIHAALQELDNEWSQATLKLMNGLVIHLQHALLDCQSTLNHDFQSECDPRSAASWYIVNWMAAFLDNRELAATSSLSHVCNLFPSPSPHSFAN